MKGDQSLLPKSFMKCWTSQRRPSARDLYTRLIACRTPLSVSVTSHVEAISFSNTSNIGERSQNPKSTEKSSIQETTVDIPKPPTNNRSTFPLPAGLLKPSRLIFWVTNAKNDYLATVSTGDLSQQYY